VTERELRAYLLGESSEDETGRLEAQLLEDEDLFRTLEGVEDDLFDDHARGRLSAAERERFEACYGPDGDRQRFARAFAKRVEGTPGVSGVPETAETPRASEAPGVLAFPRRSPWRRWTPLAAAAAIAIVAGVVMMRRESPGPAASRPVATQQPGPAAEARTAVFAITLGTSRAPAEPARLTVSREASGIQLRVRLNPADRFDNYAMDLRAASTDSQVWQSTGLRGVDTAGDLIVMATVPTADVPDGSYDLAVRGVRAGAAPSAAEDLGFVSIKVVRVP
jgi:hypothetical protein